MLGALAGDIIGSTREHHPDKTLDFELFPEGSRVTDDSVMTVATAEALLKRRDFGESYHRWGRWYRQAGYGRAFRTWLDTDDPKPYQSWGNGSAMRVSPVAWVATTEAELLELARETAMPTHDHPRGIIGAQAVALAIWLAREGATREEIRARVTVLSCYDLARTVDQIRPNYKFDVSCDGSVPEAIVCALESRDWEHAVRLAVSLGGDADTQASIAGAIAEALYGGVPAEIATRVQQMLPGDMGLVVELYGVRSGMGYSFPSSWDHESHQGMRGITPMWAGLSETIVMDAERRRLFELCRDVMLDCADTPEQLWYRRAGFMLSEWLCWQSGRRALEFRLDDRVIDQGGLELAQYFRFAASRNDGEQLGIPKKIPLTVTREAINLQGKRVALTGTFLTGSSTAVRRRLEGQGAIPVVELGDANCLIAGATLGPNWAEVPAGVSLGQAVDLASRGFPIAILSEVQWMKAEIESRMGRSA